MTMLAQIAGWARARLSSDPVALDFHDLAIARNPFPHWAALQAKGPVHWLPKASGWLVVGYDAVKTGLGRSDLLTTKPYIPVDAVLLGRDDAGHAAVRRLLASQLPASRLDHLVGAAAVLACSLLEVAEIDAVSGLAEPVSRALAADLIGLTESQVASIVEPAGKPLPQQILAIDAAVERSALRAALASEGADIISGAEATSLVRLLWLASTVTTQRAISNAALILARDPQLAATIRNRDDLIDAFVNEVLRLHTPEQAVPRLVAGRLELGGSELRPGELVYLCNGAANRDPDYFPEPSTLRLDRSGTRHLAFGGGIHHCAGAPLARRAIGEVVKALLARSGDLRLRQPRAEIAFHASLTILSPVRVDVVL